MFERNLSSMVCEKDDIVPFTTTNLHLVTHIPKKQPMFRSMPSRHHFALIAQDSFAQDCSMATKYHKEIQQYWTVPMPLQINKQTS